MSIRMGNQVSNFETQIKSEVKLITETNQPKNVASQYPLRYWVERSLDKYLTVLKDTEITNVYDLVLKEVELGLLKTVMKHTNGNQSKAAQILGLARGTLRKKLMEYNLIKRV